jgi:DNA primase
MPSFLKWLSFVETGIKKITDNEDIKLLPDNILNQFKISPVKKWISEGLRYKSQQKYQIGLDVMTERIIIPIRDELGNLVGIKGRLMEDSNIEDDKYIYLYSCPKNKLLYGLDKNYKHIIKSNEVIVVEGEKSVIKLHSLGYKNAVATASKNISKTQIDKLLRLNVPITLALDADVKKDEIDLIVEDLKYPFSLTEVNVIEDKMGFLEEKESPMDDADTWEILYKNFKNKV